MSVYPAQAAPGQLGVGPPRAATVPAATLTATASMTAVSYRSGTVITFGQVVAGEAILMPYSRTGSRIISAPRFLATATASVTTVIQNARLLAEPATATAAFGGVGGAGKGQTVAADVMGALARAPAATPWAAYRPGVRTVLAAPRRLTVLARAGVERAE